MFHRRTFCIVALFVCLSMGAEAALVRVNDGGVTGPTDDGFNITRDTDTGLDWLDLTVTIGRTFEDLTGSDGNNEFRSGGDFQGFRYATALEIAGETASGQIDSLWKSAGTGNGISSIANLVPVRDLIDFMGCTGNCSSEFDAQGREFIRAFAWGTALSDGSSSASTMTPFMSYFMFIGAPDDAITNRGNTGLDTVDLPFGGAGVGPFDKANWLVRDTPTPVPLPPTLPLFVSGVVLLRWLVSGVVKERLSVSRIGRALRLESSR